HVGVPQVPRRLRAPLERRPGRERSELVHRRGQCRVRLSPHRTLLGQSLIGDAMRSAISTCAARAMTVMTTAAIVVATGPAVAAPKKVSVVTSLNVLAGLTREVGGDRVEVTALAKPNQDPHTLVAKPTFKMLAKNANLFVEL